MRFQMRLMWLPALCLAVSGCNGTSPTAPSATAPVPGGASQVAATYTLSGTIFSFGGPTPFPLVVGIPGGPSVASDATGSFHLVGVPVHLEGAPLRIGDRELRLGFSTTAGQNVHVDIRLDLGTGTATVARLCKTTPPPVTQTPGVAVVTVSLCVESVP